MMIEVLSAYRFLRRMGGGQFLFMWEIATKLHVSEFPENMYLGVLFVKIRSTMNTPRNKQRFIMSVMMDLNAPMPAFLIRTCLFA